MAYATQIYLQDQVRATWPTVIANDTNNLDPQEFLRRKGRKPDGAVTSLSVMTAATWRSPNKTDQKGRSGPNCKAFQAGNINRLADQIEKATWPTPRKHSSGGMDHRGGDRAEEMLMTGIVKATWPTPKRPDGSACRTEKNLKHLHRMDDVVPTFGEPTSGPLARTEKFVERLTTLSAWLMGYPAKYLRHWGIR